MPSERTQRHIDRLLDEADKAMAQRDWGLVRQHVQDVLDLDPDNADARDFLAAMERKREAVGSRQSAVDPTASPSAGAAVPSPLPRGEGQGEGTPEHQTQANALVAAGVLPTSFDSGRYTVKKFLGEGGKKKVYLAHDNGLDRDVAFALIKTEGLDDIGRERVSREGQAMGRLGSHPHIVTVFDLGEEPPPFPSSPLPLGEGQGEGVRHGQPFMVTELMGGGDVEGLIKQAPDHKLPLAQVLRIADEVCAGLEYAHSQNIVHRDLKPGNVWLTEAIGIWQSAVGDEAGSTTHDPRLTSPQPSPTRRGSDEVGVAKIGDFGLAVAIDRTRLTQAGMMVGTVSYMPPEQATGGAVTPGSDLYSLGAMLYEMVAGRPPFIGDESVAIIGQHLNVAPVSPTWHRPDCPPGLEALILRLLEKDPSKRPASAREVGEALRAIAGAIQRAATRGGAGVSLSLAGEGGGEGETQAPDSAHAALDNPLYRRVFVGREAELRQLQAAFDNALSGQGGLVMVVGESGIGKTALCEQLSTYATLRGGTTLTGHCYEEGSLSLPYLAFVEALRSYVQSRPPEALRAELGPAAGDLARIVSEVRERLAIEPRPPSEPEEDRWRLLQAVSGFLRTASAVQPLVIVLEDLHWADQGTLDLLTHVARNLQGARLLVIGTYRDVEVDRSHPLSAALADLERQAGFGRVQLRGLGTPEVQRMLLAITGSEAPGSLAEAIHRQTEGNPLFVQEVIRYLVEEGHLGQGSSSPPRPLGEGKGEGFAATMTIPEGLRDVIGRRIAHLSPECNRLLAIAAVVGRDFDLATLRAIAGVEEETLVTALEAATRVGVLEEQSRPGVIRYRFAHAFFRQTLYEELSAPRRLRFHQDVARVLERQYANRLEEHAAELAEHFSQSTDPDDLAKAVQYAELAASRAMSVYAYGEAVRHLEQALDAQEVRDPDDKRKRCDLLLALGAALVPAGDSMRAAEQVAPQALALAEALDDHRRASLVCGLALEALVRYGAGMIIGAPGFRRWAELAGRYAAAGTAERARADLVLGRIANDDGRTTEGRLLLQRALALARELGDAGLYFETARILLLGDSPENANEDRLLAEEVICHSREGASAYQTAATLWSAASVFLNDGERARAEAIWREAAEIGERGREPATVMLVLGIRLATLDGELEKAVAARANTFNRADALGVPLAGRGFGNIAAFNALTYLGRSAEALENLPAATQIAGGGERLSDAARRALGLAQLGRRSEVAQVVAGLLSERGFGPNAEGAGIFSLVDLLETAVLIGDRPLAELLLPRLIPLAAMGSSGGSVSTPTCVGRHLGAAAALLGDSEAARGYYEQALELAAKMRHRPEAALTHLGIAELLLDGPHPNPLPEVEGESNPGPTETNLTPGPSPARRGEMEASVEQASQLSSLSPRGGEDRREVRAQAAAIHTEALRHLDIAIAELREMKMQPALERALRHKEVLKA